MNSDPANVLLEVSDSVAVVRLDRPQKLNAFTFRMIAEIREAVERAACDESVVGIVVTGTGRAFSAGLDTSDLALSAAGARPGSASKTATSAERSPDRAPDGELPALFSYLLQIPKPVIAAVNGVAAGGGFVLAMMCDLRFAAEGASFTTAFSKRGLIAEHGTSWILPRLVGVSRALDLLWSSRRFDATEAMRLGFVDRVVGGDRVVDEACTYLRDLAANVSPRSLAVIKEQIYRHLSQEMAPAIRESEQMMNQALAHPDAAEGVASFLERRAPRFKRWTGEKI
ncbi:MAG TPA: enoyl-CoA hydratase-related protein [Candidatus Binataceae bacterium]